MKQPTDQKTKFNYQHLKVLHELLGGWVVLQAL